MDPIYGEEKNIGMMLVPAGIDAQRGYFYLVSESALFIHDITSRKRLKYVEHGSPIVSTHIDDGLLITTTREGKKHAWSCSGERVEETCLGDLTQPLCWGYATDKELYFLSEAQAGPTNSPARTLYRLSENSADPAEPPTNRKKGTVERTLRAVLEIDFEVASKRSLAISSSYAIACAGKELRLLPYNDVAENSKAPKSFLLTQTFPGVRDELVVFDSCHIHEDSVYAALTTGRIYIWNLVSQFGLDHTNKMFINATTGKMVFLVSSNKTIFVGSGNCELAKWDLATSDAGRWDVEYLGLGAPPKMLCLSQDETLLGVVLADNTACLVQTSRMTVLHRTSVLSTPTVPALQWELCADQAIDELVAATEAVLRPNYKKKVLGCVNAQRELRTKIAISLAKDKDIISPQEAMEEARDKLAALLGQLTSLPPHLEAKKRSLIEYAQQVDMKQVSSAFSPPSKQSSTTTTLKLCEVFEKYFERYPFESPVGRKIELATDPTKLATENWGLNMEICDFGAYCIYDELKAKGVEFPATNLDSMAPIITPKQPEFNSVLEKYERYMHNRSGAAASSDEPGSSGGSKPVGDLIDFSNPAAEAHHGDVQKQLGSLNQQDGERPMPSLSPQAAPASLTQGRGIAEAHHGDVQKQLGSLNQQDGERPMPSLSPQASLTQADLSLIGEQASTSSAISTATQKRKQENPMQEESKKPKILKGSQSKKLNQKFSFT